MSATGGVPVVPRARWRRVAVLAAVTTALIVAGRLVAASDTLSPEHAREAVASAGALGVVLTVAVFVGAGLLWVPGVVLVAATVYAHGWAAAIPISFASGFLSLMVKFWLARSVGGQPLADVERPLVRRVLGYLERHPIRALVLLRLVFFMAQWVTYAVALSRVRARDYTIGTLLGLVLPVLFFVLLFDRVLR